MTKQELIEKLKKSSVAIYITVEESVANDISNLMKEAIKYLEE